MWKEATRPCDRAKRADRKEALNEDNSSNQRVAIAAVALSLAQLPPFPNKLAVNHVLAPHADAKRGMQWTGDRFNALPTTPNRGKFSPRARPPVVQASVYCRYWGLW